MNSTTFGKQFTLQVDGQVFAQPLIATNVTMADGKAHDLVLIATEHDTVYAFDADTASTQPLWSKSLLQTGETTVPAGETLSPDIQPEIGITSTPVFDSSQNILYVVSKSELVRNGQATYFQRLHALKLETGAEVLNGPTVIDASVPGSAPDAVNGQVPFNSLKSQQRSALALIDGNIWMAFSSHGDNLPYHGWLLGYSAADVSKQTYVFNDTPNGSEGGIWMGSNGPSTDGNGNIFLDSGNGTFDNTQSNYSSSSLRLTTGANKSVQIADSFTPYNQQLLSAIDYDFGVMGSILLPDQPGPLPHLLITEDKSSVIYLINRDSMGSYDVTANHVVQAAKLSPNSAHQNALFFNNTLYVSGDSAPMYAYPFNPTTQQFQTTPSSATAEVFTCPGCYVGGSAPTVSANGITNAILWTVDATQFQTPTPGVLHAYDPADLTHELYNSTQAAANRDQAANANKFATPTVANGHVYVSGNGAVDVYGLLAP
ncbi:MAG TPA: hypothetical protein VE218_12055 [Acidobacteriaceae bacterium]|nr:hypothetical protein [Acidobacteriaceae bacterium]